VAVHGSRQRRDLSVAETPAVGMLAFGQSNTFTRVARDPAVFDGGAEHLAQQT